MPPINKNSNIKLNPIGIALPIERGYNGYFNQTFDTVSQTKTNIINLLKTKRGERRFQPLFGSGLQEALFEQNLDDSTDVLRNIIINDINNWIPNVNVLNVDLSLTSSDIYKNIDIYIINVKVTFLINNTIDSVELILEQNRN